MRGASRPVPTLPSTARPRRGQAMLETLLVVLLVCLLLFGLMQAAFVFNAKEVLHHSAARAARAKAVGFNNWMVSKSQLVAAIPNSGALLEPVVDAPQPFLDPDLPPGANWDRAVSRAAGARRPAKTPLELARIPEFLASDNHLRGAAILDYEEWANRSFDVSVARSGALAAALGGSGTVRATVRQRFPLQMPFVSIIYAGETDADGVDRVTLSGESEGIDHAWLYLR